MLTTKPWFPNGVKADSYMWWCWYIYSIHEQHYELFTRNTWIQFLERKEKMSKSYKLQFLAPLVKKGKMWQICIFNSCGDIGSNTYCHVLSKFNLVDDILMSQTYRPNPTFPCWCSVRHIMQTFSVPPGFGHFVCLLTEAITSWLNGWG